MNSRGIARKWLRDNQMPATLKEYDSLAEILDQHAAEARAEQRKACSNAVWSYYHGESEVKDDDGYIMACINAVKEDE